MAIGNGGKHVGREGACDRAVGGDSEGGEARTKADEMIYRPSKWGELDGGRAGKRVRPR